MIKNIIINKEKRSIYNILKSIGIIHNGIIFGGMVRDEIIASHYKSLFDEDLAATVNSKNHYDNFWNSEYQKDTYKRVIIPNNMNIYFNNNESYENFINDIKQLVNDYNGKYRICNSSKIYDFMENLIYIKISLSFIISKTIISKGIIINAIIEVIVNNSIDINNHNEPPFSFPDFSCNLFIMSKIYNDKYEIRLSKNTGTKLDRMTYVNKINYQKRIINNLIQGKTEFIRRTITNYCEFTNGIRILNFLNKNMKITNLLFKEIETTTINQNCDICQMTVINNDEPLMEILTNKYSPNIIHKSCFIRYLRKEINKRKFNSEMTKIECRCTRQGLFNFTDSYKYSYLY